MVLENGTNRLASNLQFVKKQMKTPQYLQNIIEQSVSKYFIGQNDLCGVPSVVPDPWSKGRDFMDHFLSGWTESQTQVSWLSSLELFPTHE